MEIKFKVGDKVKCIKLDKPEIYRKYLNKYFIVTKLITNNIVKVTSIDKRLPKESIGLFSYKFEKAGQEYIILKLKGIVE